MEGPHVSLSPYSLTSEAPAREREFLQVELPEMQRLTRLYARLVDRLPSDGPDPEDRRDLRRTLYGLHAILVLHFAQEEEVYSVLDE